MHVTANGKSFLANLSTREQEEYLGGKLTSLTEHTKTDPESLRRDFTQIKKVGYATNFGELDLHVHAVAAAILNPDGKPIAALSISCPASRLPMDKAHAFGAKVIAAAKAVSQRLVD